VQDGGEVGHGPTTLVPVPFGGVSHIRYEVDGGIATVTITDPRIAGNFERRPAAFTGR